MRSQCISQALSAWPVPHFMWSWFKREPVSSIEPNLYQQVLDHCIYRHPHQSKREGTPCLSPVRKGKTTLSFAMGFHIPVKTLLVWFAIIWDWDNCAAPLFMPQLSTAASWRQESQTWGVTLKYEYLQYDHGYKATNTTKSRQWLFTGQGTGSIQTGIVWILPLFICFWPMQGPVMISALEGDNTIPQFAIWGANMSNKLGHDPILTICWCNSWGAVVFTKVKNACQALKVINTTFPPFNFNPFPLLSFFHRKAWHWRKLDKNFDNERYLKRTNDQYCTFHPQLCFLIINFALSVLVFCFFYWKISNFSGKFLASFNVERKKAMAYLHFIISFINCTKSLCSR